MLESVNPYDNEIIEPDVQMNDTTTKWTGNNKSYL